MPVYQAMTSVLLISVLLAIFVVPKSTNTTIIGRAAQRETVWIRNTSVVSNISDVILPLNESNVISQSDYTSKYNKHTDTIFYKLFRFKRSSANKVSGDNGTDSATSASVSTRDPTVSQQDTHGTTVSRDPHSRTYHSAGSPVSARSGPHNDTQESTFPTRFENTTLSSTITHDSTMPSTITEDTTLPTTITEDTTLPSIVTEDTTLPSTITEDTTLPSTITEDTTLPSTITEDTTLPSTITEDTTLPSTITEDTTLPSTITDDSTMPSTITEDTTMPSTITDDSTMPSTITEDTTMLPNITDGSTMPSTITDESTMPSNITDNSTMPSTITDDSTMPSTITDDSTMPSTITEDTTMLPNITDGSTMPSTITDGSTMPSTITDGSTMPSTITDDSTMSSTITDDSTMPSTITDDSTMPSTITEDTTMLPNITDGSTMPSTITDDSTMPSTITDGSTMPSTITDDTISTLTDDTVSSTLTDETSVSTTPAESTSTQSSTSAETTPGNTSEDVTVETPTEGVTTSTTTTGINNSTSTSEETTLTVVTSTHVPTTETPSATDTPEADRDVSVEVVAAILGLLLLGGLVATGAVMYRQGKLPWKARKSHGSVRPQPIHISRFENQCSQLLETPARLGSEFQLLQTLSADVVDTNTFVAAQLPDNKKKNRYINILPYDMTRVKLEVTNDDPSDYINASYIKGYSNTVEYIASQGPKEETLDDFWRMMYQQNIRVIAMVTNCEEGGKRKCEPYFPKLRDQMIVGDSVIRCATELHFPMYTQRSIVLHKDGKKRSITHLHFNEWPDFGCPEGTDSMLQFCGTLRYHMASSSPGLALVHCSAGVGRTGTLIALDILLQHIQENKKVDIFGTVYKLRKQRTNMVQTEGQYAYIYKCVNDAIQDSTWLKQEKSPTNSLEPIYENVPTKLTTFIYEKLPDTKAKINSSESECEL